MTEKLEINPLSGIVEGLAAFTLPVTMTMQRPAPEDDPGVFTLDLAANGRAVRVQWARGQGMHLPEHPAVQLQWARTEEQVRKLAELLHVPVVPQSSWEPWEEEPRTPQRERLLPLARMAGAHVHARLSYGDPHLAMRIADGLHDDFPEVQGALDGLVHMEDNNHWRMDELSHSAWSKERGCYTVPGPTPPQQLRAGPEAEG